MENEPVTISAGELTQRYPRLPTPTSIRLLTITPRSDDTTADTNDSGPNVIRAAMAVADLEDPDLDFIALSYVWGDTKTAVLSLDNTGSVNITDNLQLALSDLRGQIDGPTRVWVDALCINQANVAERSGQVAMMYRIYSAASRVVVHLGRAADGSDSVPDFVERLGKVVEMAYEDSPDSPVLVRDSTGQYDLGVLGLPAHHTLEWLTLQRFFSRRWFHRSWTLQEAQAGREVVLLCEGWAQGLPLQLLSHVLTLIAILGWPCYCDSSIQARLHGFPEPPLLLEVLHLGRTDSCSDPRDAIYAYLGVSIEADNTELSPNYDQDVKSIYTKFAEHFVRSGHGVEMLYHCYMDRIDSSMPSWVPRWNSADTSRIKRPLIWDPQTLNKADVYLGEDHNVLIAKAAIIDQIDLVGSPRPPDTGRLVHISKICTEVLTYLGELDDLLSQRTSPMKPPYADFARAKWHALTAEAFGGEYNEQALSDPDFLTFYTTVLPYVRVQGDKEDWPEDRLAPFKARHFELVRMSFDFSSKIYSISTLRRSCVTARGFLGNIDSMSEPGDVLAQIRGTPRPFILRPVRLESGEQRYRVVGHGYFVGLDEGEAWEWSDTAVEDLHIV